MHSHDWEWLSPTCGTGLTMRLDCGAVDSALRVIEFAGVFSLISGFVLASLTMRLVPLVGMLLLKILNIERRRQVQPQRRPPRAIRQHQRRARAQSQLDDGVDVPE